MKTLFLLILLSSLIEATTRMQIHMHTYITISSDASSSVINDGFGIFKDIDYTLSSYKKEALVYQLNETKHIQNNDYLYESMMLAKKYYKESDGYFDITIGSLTKDIYRFGENPEYIIYEKTLDKSEVNFNGIHLSKNHTSLEKGVKVDFGGMGKGYAVEKVVKYFQNKRVNKAIVSASGDIACIGLCSFGVQNPFKEGSMFEFRTKKDYTSISTSGNYQRYIKNKNYNHLLNPYTKSSQKLFSSITLISEGSSSDLDAYATAVSVMPKDKSLKFLKTKSIAYIIILNSKKMILSDNLYEYVELFSENTMSEKIGYIEYTPSKKNK